MDFTWRDGSKIVWTNWQPGLPHFAAGGPYFSVSGGIQGEWIALRDYHYLTTCEAPAG